jgi:hypothetical protein
MAGEIPLQHASCSFPYKQGLSVGTRHDPQPIRRELGSPNDTFVSNEHAQALASVAVPQPQIVVMRRAEDSRSVKATAADFFVVAFEGV